MQRGYLDRREDVSGVTGTGDVCEIAIAADGRATFFWPEGVGVWPSLEAAMKVHGHNGKTIAIILDDPAEAHCVECHSQNMVCEVHGYECPGCLDSV